MQKKLEPKAARCSLPKLLIILGLAFVSIVTWQALSGQQKAWAATDSCTPPATTYGTDTMTVSVPETATYTVWARMEIPASSSNTILLNIGSGSSCYDIGDSSAIPANAWEWIDYNDGNTANAIRLSLSQGNHTFELIGTAQNVAVDRIEALSDASCVPSGTGDNCTSSQSSSSGGGGSSSGSSPSTSGSTESSSSKGNSTPVVTTKDGTTIVTPVTTTTPLQITAPVTFQPAATSQPIKKVQYYLNKKLLATVSVAPYRYRLNTRDILNGTYTFTTKTYYVSGKITTTAQKLIIKNPYSFTQFRLQVLHYSIQESIVLIILVTAAYFLFRKRCTRLLRRLTGKQFVAQSGDISDPDLKSFVGPESYIPNMPTKSDAGDAYNHDDTTRPTHEA
jgi:hypothetical protein